VWRGCRCSTGRPVGFLAGLELGLLAGSRPLALATAMPSRLRARVTSASSSAIIAAVGAGEAVVDVDALGVDAECHQRVLLGGEVLGVVETRAYPSLSSATCRVSPVRPPLTGHFRGRVLRECGRIEITRGHGHQADDRWRRRRTVGYWDGGTAAEAGRGRPLVVRSSASATTGAVRRARRAEKVAVGRWGRRLPDDEGAWAADRWRWARPTPRCSSCTTRRSPRSTATCCRAAACEWWRRT